MTIILNEQISNISRITEHESYSINAGSTITSGNSLSNDNQSNPTPSTSTSTISVSQIIKYDPNSTFQKLLKEAQQIYKNQINDTTRLQYLSTSTAFGIFIFKNYHNNIPPPCIDKYKEWYEN